MGNILKIASRNLLRYRRRTLLTSALVVLGIVAVMVFVAVAGSFKAMMVGQITDSMLGHLQVHRRGFVASIENLPLNLNMPAEMVDKVSGLLGSTPEVSAWSSRIKFGAGFSNFAETTNIRIVGIDPQAELSVTPLSAGRVRGRRGGSFMEKGEILVPELLARGMKVKVGDTVVLVATNKDGSVNGKTFVVRGELASVTGPGGRDGFIHVDDARELLRMTTSEVSEIAVRLKDPEAAERVAAALEPALGATKGMDAQAKKPGGGSGMGIEVHPWQRLTPFANIANMIDMMTLFIKIMLVSIVLISVMNVMVMAVYERIREIGTISAIGTPPRRVLSLFLAEGLILGLLGAVTGSALSLAAIYGLKAAKLTFNFGQQQGLILSPSIGAQDVIAVAGIVVLVAVLASLQPAWKASRMDPIQALRHV
jgi:putative ABC transport system permease protein